MREPAVSIDYLMLALEGTFTHRVAQAVIWYLYKPDPELGSYTGQGRKEPDKLMLLGSCFRLSLYALKILIIFAEKNKL